MIQLRSMVKVADNSGAVLLQVFQVVGGSRHRYARIGDKVVASVKIAEPGKAVKKKDVVHAVIIRTRASYRRKDGTYVRFDDNAAVVLEGSEPKGGRVFGPVPRELRERGFTKIVSLASEVV